MKYIHREQYQNLIAPFIRKPLIKVLTGQRRVGKSFLLYQLMHTIGKSDKDANCIYINMEHEDFYHIKNYEDLSAYISEALRDDLNNYLFIDEIQEVEGFEKSLRSLLAKEQADIYITGSNAYMFSGELSTTLSGRYVEFKVYGLDFMEFLKFNQLEPSKDSLLKYLRYGGLPGLHKFELSDFVVFDYLKNIYAAILFKDVVRRHNIRNVSFLENLCRFLAENTGSMVSSKKISDYLKSQNISVSVNLVMDYLTYLTGSYFILKAPRSDIQGKRHFEIGEKYYFEDLGLRHSIAGYKANDINKVMENVVYLQLLRQGYKVSVGWESGREIDFIGQKENEKIYVQVCYQISDESVHKREFGNLMLIKNNYPKMVVSMDDMAGEDYKGIRHVHLLNFLMPK